MIRLFFSSLTIALAALVIVHLGFGEAGFDLSQPGTLFAVAEIRLPRVIGAITVGFASALATALLQLSLRSGIAEPALFGVSSFAGLGVLVGLGVGLGFGSVESWLLSFFAGCVGLVPLVIIFRRMRGVESRRNSQALILPLTGIAIGAVGTSLVGILAIGSPDPRLRSLAVWAFGTLSLQTLDASLLGLGVCIGLVLLFVAVNGPLARLALGPAILRGLGIRSSKLTLISLALVAALSATASFGTGSIAFVGLLSVAISRMLVGPDLLLSGLGAGLLATVVLLGSDLLAKSVATPVDLPIGLFTSLLGAPLLIWTMLRRANA